MTRIVVVRTYMVDQTNTVHFLGFSKGKKSSHPGSGTK